MRQSSWVALGIIAICISIVVGGGAGGYDLDFYAGGVPQGENEALNIEVATDGRMALEAVNESDRLTYTLSADDQTPSYSDGAVTLSPDANHTLTFAAGPGVSVALSGTDDVPQLTIAADPGLSPAVPEVLSDVSSIAFQGAGSMGSVLVQLARPLTLAERSAEIIIDSRTGATTATDTRRVQVGSVLVEDLLALRPTAYQANGTATAEHSISMVVPAGTGAGVVRLHKARVYAVVLYVASGAADTISVDETTGAVTFGTPPPPRLLQVGHAIRVGVTDYPIVSVGSDGAVSIATGTAVAAQTGYRLMSGDDGRTFYLSAGSANVPTLTDVRVRILP